jgi:hypothetical protein
VSDVPENIDDSVEAGSSVLCLYYTYVHEETLARQATTVSRDLPFLSNKTDVVG